jgi:hypothetical protein
VSIIASNFYCVLIFFSHIRLFFNVLLCVKNAPLIMSFYFIQDTDTVFGFPI